MSISVSVPATSTREFRLSTLEKLILDTLARHQGNRPFHAYDFEMPGILQNARALSHQPALAWFLNLWGPDIDSFRATLLRLEYRGLVTFYLESQDDAEGHGLVNWNGPAPRYRFYRLTADGLRAVKN